MVYYSILDYAMLCYTILYYTILYYTMLYTIASQVSHLSAFAQRKPRQPVRR